MEKGPSKELMERFDLSYWRPYEYGAGSAASRQITSAADPLHTIMQSLTAPMLLMQSAIAVLSDGIDQRAKSSEARSETFRHLPPALITFAAGFEAFVRFSAEVFVEVAKDLPPSVRHALLETEESVDGQGRISTRTRYRPTMDRFAILLRYGCGKEIDRGSKEWQDANQAIGLRDQIVHYKIQDCPALKASQVLTAMKALLVLPIAASGLIGRSLWYCQFDLYAMLDSVADDLKQVGDFEEAPLHKDWPHHVPLSFPCPFINVDESKYPVSGSR
jgi:hypothetical protein